LTFGHIRDAHWAELNVASALGSLTAPAPKVKVKVNIDRRSSPRIIVSVKPSLRLSPPTSLTCISPYQTMPRYPACFADEQEKACKHARQYYGTPLHGMLHEFESRWLRLAVSRFRTASGRFQSSDGVRMAPDGFQWDRYKLKKQHKGRQTYT